MFWINFGDIESSECRLLIRWEPKKVQISNHTLRLMPVRQLSENSTSTQGNNNSKYVENQLNSTSIIIIIGIIGSALILGLGFFLFYLFRHLYRRHHRLRRQRMAREKFEHFQKKKHYFRVKQIIADMQKGFFESLKSKYHEQKWVIWMENFESYSYVAITNECSHWFHKKCLKEWFRNSEPGHVLRWPLWNTINRQIVRSKADKASSNNIETAVHVDQDRHSMYISPPLESDIERGVVGHSRHSHDNMI